MKKFLSLIGLLLIPSLVFGDATTAARQRNFVNDKNGSVPITASYMDGEFDNVIGKLNAKVIAKSTAPSSPTTGDTWVDTTSSPPLIKVYDGSNWGIGAFSKGADVASTASMTLGSDGTFFDITGTTTITSITAKSAGSIVIMQFDGALQVTDGSNLKLQGNFTTAAESVLGLVSDGTNWFEMFRQPCLFTPSATNALAGSVLQVVNTLNVAMTTGTTAIPYDDTIPQNTEGDEILTRAITASSTTNKFLIRAVISLSNNTAEYTTIALFQDSTAGALASVAQYPSTSTQNPHILTLEYFMTTGTTSSTTFKIRAGGQGGTVTINGVNGARKWGGSNTCSLTVMEVKV